MEVAVSGSTEHPGSAREGRCRAAQHSASGTTPPTLAEQMNRPGSLSYFRPVRPVAPRHELLPELQSLTRVASRPEMHRGSRFRHQQGRYRCWGQQLPLWQHSHSERRAFRINETALIPASQRPCARIAELPPRSVRDSPWQRRQKTSVAHNRKCQHQIALAHSAAEQQPRARAKRPHPQPHSDRCPPVTDYQPPITAASALRAFV